ncbi:MAG TPA: four helix bundle protein [Planctomycetaceae bacterium]|nr:four helix bundle protein [Planctomycetaceae bacterium]
MDKLGSFRFQELLIWQRAADIGVGLDDMSVILDEKKKYRFAEQLRAAGLSISNNIAEGSGSNSNADFRKFLYIARKSLFECASMLLVFERRNYFTAEQIAPVIDELDTLSRMIVSFASKLK